MWASNNRNKRMCVVAPGQLHLDLKIITLANLKIFLVSSVNNPQSVFVKCTELSWLILWTMHFLLTQDISPKN